MEMTEKYTTIIKNDYFTHQKPFVSVKVEANDLATFVKVVEHLKALPEFME